ncbi:MAG: hypothetical protein LBP32_05490 [Spirochaetaceae bacterium]|jgi:hypothetical protein|nr:hypothetical protein [Spirochaetaceae bacterium]
MAEEKISVIRVKELGDREATVLEHDLIRVLVADTGGMIPELSGIQGPRHINAHWLPWFRSNSGKNYNDADHGAFWKANLLYNLAGNFPCVPNFGPGHIIDGVNMPVHGWTANLKWQFAGNGIDEESGAAWALSTMESPDQVMPLSFKKIDAVIPHHPVHYVSLSVKNRGDADIEICAGWHNTLGAPFIQPGCRISGAAQAWTTPPPGGEFDATTRLALGTEFSSLNQAPLAKGGKVDISLTPGPIGYTDFAAGAIPASAGLGWSSVVNPALKMAYICFFTGQASSAEDDIVLRFNDLWMQYGGRPFTPWAPYEGGTDLTYCLGTENSAAAYAYGLEYSREVQRVLGAPTTVTIPGRGEKILRYGSLFAPYEDNLDQGVTAISAEESALACAGTKGTWRFKADPSFALLKGIHSRHAGL